MDHTNLPKIPGLNETESRLLWYDFAVICIDHLDPKMAQEYCQFIMSKIHSREEADYVKKLLLE